MKIMGIDPSLTNFAVSLIGSIETHLSYPGKEKEHEVFKSKKKDVHRLKEIQDFLLHKLKFFNPDYVGIEGYGFCSMKGVVLGELGSVIRLALLDFFGEKYNSKVFIIPPTTIKKYVTGKGNCEKSLILKNVYKKWNFDTDDNNLADSYSIAQLVKAIVVKEDQPRPIYEQEIINNIIKNKTDCR